MRLREYQIIKNRQIGEAEETIAQNDFLYYTWK